MKTLSKEFDKKFVYKHKGIDYLQADPKDIKTFIHQREKKLLDEVKALIMRRPITDTADNQFIDRNTLLEVFYSLFEEELSNE